MVHQTYKISNYLKCHYLFQCFLLICRHILRDDFLLFLLIRFLRKHWLLQLVVQRMHFLNSIYNFHKLMLMKHNKFRVCQMLMLSVHYRQFPDLILSNYHCYNPTPPAKHYSTLLFHRASLHLRKMNYHHLLHLLQFPSLSKLCFHLYVCQKFRNLYTLCFHL